MTIGDSLGPEGRRSALQGVSGWLLFLCINLLIFLPFRILLTLVAALQSETPVEEPVATYAFLSLILAFNAFGVFAGILLYQERRLGLHLARLFYAVQVALVAFALLGDPGVAITSPFATAFSFGPPIAWLIYLFRSERVTATYLRTDTATVSEVFR